MATINVFRSVAKISAICSLNKQKKQTTGTHELTPQKSKRRLMRCNLKTIILGTKKTMVTVILKLNRYLFIVERGAYVHAFTLFW